MGWRRTGGALEFSRLGPEGFNVYVDLKRSIMQSRPDVPSTPVAPIVRAGLRTPRAAAIAGIIFSVLLISSLWLLRLSVPADPHETGAWLATETKRVTIALNLVPYAGIAFLWFIGVLRDRLGAREDRFFATVFLGSGLLFLGMLFVAAAAAGGLLLAYTVTPSAAGGALPGGQVDPSTFGFVRAFIFAVMRIYAFKMAGVFMIAVSTLACRTRFIPLWIALLGYGCSALLLLGSGVFDWVLFVFPAWVLLVSGVILVDKWRLGATAS